MESWGERKRNGERKFVGEFGVFEKGSKEWTKGGEYMYIEYIFAQH
jgi:hypothetical protein